MFDHPLCIPMSQIIASDAPLLSPVGDASWDQLYSPTSTNFSFNYYNLPPSPPNSVGSTSTDSPIPTARMLKMRMSPDSSSESEQLCLPTHQVFDFPEFTQPPTPPSPTMSSPPRPERLSIAINNAAVAAAQPQPPAKRSASPPPAAAKKPRASGERISSKEFVPPDVSGLSKREARLVKNRAAAFLSRQRKREEFECMEVRVAELEQENARLLALAKNGNAPSQPKSDPDPALKSEVEQLRARLAQAEERERELAKELAQTAGTRDAPIKVESSEIQFPLSPARSPASPPHKSGASFGLMVLLCALPSLLSMPAHSTPQTSFALPNSGATAPSSSFDYNSFIPNEYAWSRNNGNSAVMDLDIDEQGRIVPGAATSSSGLRKLEFAGTDSTGLSALSNLDISFDTTASEDGKIRVRIHPSSAASSASGSPTASSSKLDHQLLASSLGMWAGADADADFAGAFPSGFPSPAQASPLAYTADPFLGVGASGDYGLHFAQPAGAMMYGGDSDMASAYTPSPSEFSFGSDISGSGSSEGGKRRVRIALKSMPAAGGEGGEWEVQFC